METKKTWQNHKGLLHDSVGGFDVIDCTECGFKHVVPIPTQEELHGVYKEEYYTTEKPQFIERQIEDLDWWNVVFNDRYEFFEQSLPSGRRRILDIGCGPGYFLKRGMERNWDCLGIEPSRQAAEHAKQIGVNVINRFFYDAGLKQTNDTFDVIHMSEVLEHIADPTGLCMNAYDLIDNGGIICIVVPNDYNPIQEILRTKLGYNPYWLAPPHHINYFDYDSVEKLLKRCGFEIIKRTAMYPMDLFLLMGDNYVGDDQLGRACHAKRKNFDLLLTEHDLTDFRRGLYDLMASHGIGRETVVFGGK